jgi:hypothetical protein
MNEYSNIGNKIAAFLTKVEWRRFGCPREPFSRGSPLLKSNNKFPWKQPRLLNSKLNSYLFFEFFKEILCFSIYFIENTNKIVYFIEIYFINKIYFIENTKCA